MRSDVDRSHDRHGHAGDGPGPGGHSTTRRSLTLWSRAALALREWINDDVVRRLLRNVVHLFSGKAVAAALGVVTLAIMARALGPAALGVLVMIEAFARLIDQIVRAETWHALIRHGSVALEQDRQDDFRQLIKFGGLIDVGGALAAATVVLLTVPLAGDWLGWSSETAQMAQIYGLVLVFHVASTPIAVLRLFDRFKYLAWLEACSALLRLLLATVAWQAGGGLWTFLLVLMSVEIAHNLTLVGLAWRELRSRGHGGFVKSRMEGVTRSNPRIWNFILSTNITILIRKSTEQLDALIVGSVIGPAAVGIYYVAKRLGNAALKYGALLQQAAFPDLARLWARREVDRFRRTVMQVSLVTAAFAGAVLLFVWFNADLIVRLVAGSGFEEAALPLIVQMGAMTLALSGVTLRPALLSMGRQGSLLKIVLAAALGFYLCMLVALPQLGVVGASLAHVVFHAVWLPAVLTVFLRGTRARSG